MDEKVVYDLLTLLTKTTLVDKCKSPLLRLSIVSCHPSEESNMRWSLHLPKALPRKREDAFGLDVNGRYITLVVWKSFTNFSGSWLL
jgi:hypothetical protein